MDWKNKSMNENILKIEVINLLNQSGLVLNIAGSLLIAFSFGKHLGDAYNIDNRGKKVYMASFLHPRLFRIGIYFLVFGFILIFVSTFINK
jgi:hypothetical protein